MDKEKYISVQMEVIEFEMEDIITTSIVQGGNNDTIIITP